MFTLRILTITVFVGGAFTELGCRNEKDQPVDWYMLYKLPRLSKSSNPNEKVGEAYAALDAKNGVWVHSSKSVEDPNSYIATTYQQILKGVNKLAYLVYNDQKPESNTSSTSWGHTKGILATDGVTGFWLVHSVPKFPLPPSTGQYNYPKNAKEHGQSLLCITFSFSQLPKIVETFRYTRPQIYARRINSAVESLPTTVSGFFTGKPQYIKKAPWNATTPLISKAKQPFTIFGKHKKYGKDLYDSFVAPALSANLYVQTWQVGAGTKLLPDCHDKFSVYNIDAMTLAYNRSNSTSFLSTDDHSKWASTQDGFPPWVCVGDINRMESQFKRGGGTVCLRSPKAWKAYSSTIKKFEGCPTVTLVKG